jgi:transposase
MAAIARLPSAGQLAFCWAHVRRRFYELAGAGPAPIASEALKRIAELYAVETEIRGRSADERRALRQEKSRPILDELEPWLRTKLGLISQKTKLAEAIRYALSRWEGLTRFLDDGRIEVDSNVVERSIRPIAMNESLYPSSSSVCKHWDLVFWIELIRASFTPHRLDHAVGLEVGGADLIRRARNDLLCGQDAGFDQRSDAVAGDAVKSRGFDHGQPLTVLHCGTIGVDATDASD